ncbi:MAG TPA: hypothetical protein VH370_14145 [Humisphaera sp.]|jgi:hypothetical protein|nr:hypothetical protein [Humisphaera sp.]
MTSPKLALKLFAADGPPLAADAIIPIFHSWIQQHAFSDHLLIDVADYAHVPQGPGTVLISREANLSMDKADNRLGLLYMRKQPIVGAESFEQRLAAVFRSALEAAAKLEEEVALRGKLRFRTDEISFRIYDRLLAPNEPATFEQVKPALQKFAEKLYGGAAFTLERVGKAEELFEVKIKSGKSEGVAVLRERLAR